VHDSIPLYVSVQLTEKYAFHVIVLPHDSHRQYVSCAEVSALLWDEDILRTKVASWLAYRWFKCTVSVVCLVLLLVWSLYSI